MIPISTLETFSEATAITVAIRLVMQRFWPGVLQPWGTWLVAEGVMAGEMMLQGRFTPAVLVQALFSGCVIAATILGGHHSVQQWTARQPRFRRIRQ